MVTPIVLGEEFTLKPMGGTVLAVLCLHPKCRKPVEQFFCPIL